MDPVIFFKGLLIGSAMAVPIGPVGVLCVRKTLHEGHSRGFIIGLGAATADFINASVAAFGLTYISDIIASQHVLLRLLGGAALLVLGIRTLRAKHRNAVSGLREPRRLGSYVSALLLALTNPMTIFAFIAVFAALGLGTGLSIISASVLVLGVFAGSLLWFLTLGYVSTLFSARLDTDGLRWVNAIGGVMIILSGIAAFVSVI
jgi:threonine/homoserine/homoserine lactone efflux protein